MNPQLPFCTMGGHSVHTPGQGMRPPGAGVFRAGTSGLGAMLEGGGYPSTSVRSSPFRPGFPLAQHLRVAWAVSHWAAGATQVECGHASIHE